MTDTQTVPTLADVFRQAAVELRERGHCQGELIAADGRVCAQGALHAALGSYGITWCSLIAEHCRDALAASLSVMVDREFSSTDYDLPGVAAWNDEQDREPSEVEKLFIFAADRAEVSP